MKREIQMVQYKVYKEGKTESIVIERKNKHGNNKFQK